VGLGVGVGLAVSAGVGLGVGAGVAVKAGVGLAVPAALGLAVGAADGVEDAGAVDDGEDEAAGNDVDGVVPLDPPQPFARTAHRSAAQALRPTSVQLRDVLMSAGCMVSAVLPESGIGSRGS
jgi:hypothetical protein